MNTKQILGGDFANVVAPARNEIVFEHRHRAYGAYQLRRDYQGNVIKAMFITCFGFLAISALAGWWFNRPKDVEDIKRETYSNVLVDLTPPETEKPLELEVPKAEPVTRKEVLESTAFTPPVVTDDKLPDDKGKVQDDLLDKNIAKTDAKGDDKGDDIVIDDKTTGPHNVTEDSNKPYLSVEEMPVFPGGDAGLFKFISQHITYPREMKEMGIAGTVWVYFVVGKDGKVEDISLLRGVKGGKELETEALRVIGELPAWTPGKHNGNPVRVQYQLPIKFSLGR